MIQLSEKSDIINELKSAAEKAGNTYNLAQSFGVCEAYVRLCMSGHKEPGPSILAPLGYVKVRAYRKVG